MGGLAQGDFAQRGGETLEQCEGAKGREGKEERLVQRIGIGLFCLFFVWICFCFVNFVCFVFVMFFSTDRPKTFFDFSFLVGRNVFWGTGKKCLRF